MTSTNISAHEYLEAFAACFDRLKLSLPQGRREYSVIFWSILAGRWNQTTRPGIKRIVSKINEEPKLLFLNCLFRYFYIGFILNLPRKLRRLLASLEESAGAFYYFVINFVSLKPTGVLVPSENSQLRDNAVVASQRRCNAALRQCYPEVCLFRALSLPDRTV